MKSREPLPSVLQSADKQNHVGSFIDQIPKSKFQFKTPSLWAASAQTSYGRGVRQLEPTSLNVETDNWKLAQVEI